MAPPLKLTPHNHLAYALPVAPVVSEALSPLERRFAVALFIMGMVMYFVVNIHRVAIPGQIFSQMQTELNVSASAIAGLGTSFMYIYALTQILVGVLVDRYGGMRVLTLGGVVMSVGTVLFAFSHAPWMLYVSRGLVGLGCGCAYLSMVKECSRLYPRRFTSVLGFVVFFGYTGGIAGTYPFVRGVDAYGWRIGMLGIAALGIILLIGIAVLWRFVKKPPLNHAAVISFAPYRNGLTNFNMLKCILSVSLCFSLYYVVLTVIGKKFLEDIGGLSASTAALCCSIMVFLSAISNQATGIMSSSLGNRRRIFLLWQTLAVPTGCLLLIAGLLFCRHSPWLGPLLILAFLFITMASGFSPVTNAVYLEISPPALTGVSVGIGNFSAYAFVGLFSNFAGSMLDLFRKQAQVDAAGTVLYPDKAYLVVFSVFLLVAVGSHVVARSLPETQGRNIYDGLPRPFKLFGLIPLKLHT